MVSKTYHLIKNFNKMINLKGEKMALYDLETKKAVETIIFEYNYDEFLEQNVPNMKFNEFKKLVESFLQNKLTDGCIEKVRFDLLYYLYGGDGVAKIRR